MSEKKKNHLGELPHRRKKKNYSLKKKKSGKPKVGCARKQGRALFCEEQQQVYSTGK